MEVAGPSGRRGVFLDRFRRSVHTNVTVASLMLALLAPLVNWSLIGYFPLALVARFVWLGDFQLCVGNHVVTTSGLVSLRFNTHERYCSLPERLNCSIGPDLLNWHDLGCNGLNGTCFGTGAFRVIVVTSRSSRARGAFPGTLKRSTHTKVTDVLLLVSIVEVLKRDAPGCKASDGRLARDLERVRSGCLLSLGPFFQVL